MRRVLLGLLGLAAAAQTPPEPYLKPHLPKWISLGGEYRFRAESPLGIGYRDGNDDAYALSRFRLNLTLRPHNGVTLFAQAHDSQAWRRDQRGFPPFAENSIDLRQAYVELGGTESKHFGLRVGRQEFAFADQRLIGNANWPNGARSFDAVRATMRRGGVRVDAFASTVVVIRDGTFDKPQKGNNFHGVYATLTSLVPKQSIEPFVFWRLSPGAVDFKAAGLRSVGKLPSDFDYASTMLVEAGAVIGQGGPQDLRAWGGSWQLGHTLVNRKFKPRLSVEYNFATGDDSPSDRVRRTFELIYPTPHDIWGLADQIGWRNLHHWRSGIEFKPSPRWRIVGNYHSWWRASLYDHVYAPLGAISVRSTGPSAGRHIGQGTDLQGFLALNPHTAIAMGVTHIYPGEFLKRASAGAAYTYPYLMVTWTF
jgi:hypothetical protein